MLSKDTMKALADMFEAEPALAKLVAEVQDPNQFRALVRSMADERGIAWQEDQSQPAELDDAQLDGVSGGSLVGDFMDGTRDFHQAVLAALRSLLGDRP